MSDNVTWVYDKYGCMTKEALDLLMQVPGVVWKKSDLYQKAYKLVPFAAPQEWLDTPDLVLGEQ